MNESYEKLQFRSLNNHVNPRCPKCKKTLSNWSDWITHWQKTSNMESIECKHCKNEFSLVDINWRHNAAFAHCFITIWHIFPQEAIPSEELLTMLMDVTGQEWGYFFSD